MATDLCDHSDLPKETCSHCQGHVASGEEKRPVKPAATGPRFRRGNTKVAEFASQCPGCGEDIETGDHIKTDASGDWCHEECA